MKTSYRSCFLSSFLPAFAPFPVHHYKAMEGKAENQKINTLHIIFIVHVVSFATTGGQRPNQGDHAFVV